MVTMYKYEDLLELFGYNMNINVMVKELVSLETKLQSIEPKISLERNIVLNIDKVNIKLKAKNIINSSDCFKNICNLCSKNTSHKEGVYSSLERKENNVEVVTVIPSLRRILSN